MGAFELIRSLATRFDGWINPFSGFGDPSRDKTTGGTYLLPDRLLDPELSALFHGTGLGAKICNIVPREATRQGIIIKGGDVDKAANLGKALNDLCTLENVEDTWTWARCFGGAGTFIGADDGQTADQPLIEDNVKAFNWMHVYDRRRMTAQQYYVDPSDPKFTKPKTYMISPVSTGGGTPIVVHESRLLIFRGAKTGDEERAALASWDYSVMQGCYESLRSYGTAAKAAELMLTDASQSVFKMSGLLAKLATESGRTDLYTRMQMVDMTRGLTRSVMLDADQNESFDKIATVFTGVSDVLKESASRVSADADIPLLLLGISSANGLNAKDDAGVRLFYDRIRSFQKMVLLPALSKVLRILCILQGLDPNEYTIDFPSLWQETPAEFEARRLVVAQRDQIYIQNDVVTPSQVAEARFGEAWSPEIKLDPEDIQETEDLGVASADIAAIITVNQALASKGLPPKEGPEGELTIPTFKAQNAPPPTVPLLPTGTPTPFETKRDKVPPESGNGT